MGMNTYAWKDDLIAQAYNLSSGSLAAKYIDNANGTGWFAASSKPGCGDAEAGERSLLKCMRSKSMDRS